jgi:nucleoside-diphosphate-sugar epimerase
VRPEAVGKVVIFAGRRPVTIAQLVETIARIAGVEPLPLRIPAAPVQWAGSLTEILCKPLGIEPPIYRRRVDFFTKSRSFDTTAARTELGYEPRKDFEAEVRSIYEWYRDHGWIDASTRLEA